MVIFACPLFKWNEKFMKISQTACPAAAGLAVIALLRLRQKDCLPSQRAVMGLVAAGCAVVFVVGLVQGIPPLLAGLGV